MSDPVRQEDPVTTSAYDSATGTVVYFTDLVSENQIVNVYRTYENAESEIGPWRQMRVVLDKRGEWQLEPAVSSPHKEKTSSASDVSLGLR